jgi:hypothetical protein|eukprot:COSAG03_NODE_1177_length_4643_cov_2.109815_4_plen_73_part_00
MNDNSLISARSCVSHAATMSASILGWLDAMETEREGSVCLRVGSCPACHCVLVAVLALLQLCQELARYWLLG